MSIVWSVTVGGVNLWSPNISEFIGCIPADQKPEMMLSGVTIFGNSHLTCGIRMCSIIHSPIVEGLEWSINTSIKRLQPVQSAR